MNLCFFVFSFLFFSVKRFLHFLRYFQQEGYQAARFLRWILKARVFDKRASLALLSAVFFHLIFPFYSFYFGGLLFFILALLEENPLKAGKVRFVLTRRVKQIFAVSFSLYLAVEAILCFLPSFSFLCIEIALLQSIPLFLVLAARILSPFEKHHQKIFLKEAVQKLKEISPYVIGITGSYGKTSTKHALGSMLQTCLGPTFWPKDGVNTEMGITREIRENLKKETQYAVIEMGAYGKGSIARLCQLTPPQSAIITAVGVAHLDRFGSREAIFRAKSELAQALGLDGLLVCNGDSEGARLIGETYAKKETLFYGFDHEKGRLDCWIKEAKFVRGRMEFVFLWKEKEYAGSTGLIGRNALLNVAGSFTMASALGANPELVLGAIYNLQPVNNRLQLQKKEGVTFLMDAYNSNPDGFLDALDMLSSFQTGKRILVTPGMIEISAIEKQLHHKIGEKAGKICDFAVLVGETNRESLKAGLLSGGMKDCAIIPVSQMKNAFEWLKEVAKPGDAVLIENDLPDLYEGKIRI